MKRPARPAPPRSRRHSTVGPALPPRREPPRSNPPARIPARRRSGRLSEADELSLLDVIDNLLGKGVVLNAELVLALADVDLVFVRLSALLCAADRVLPPRPR
ncbi:MAG TPA: gas vesicle protein [Vicinamibacterales bacterium]|nr:gas vesicle protein [Vicinamibacterales bacterium]